MLHFSPLTHSRTSPQWFSLCLCSVFLSSCSGPLGSFHLCKAPLWTPFFLCLHSLLWSHAASWPFKHHIDTYQYNSRIFLSSSDLSLTSRFKYSIAHLLFLLECLMGTSKLVKTPYRSPQISSSTTFPVSANVNSIPPAAQAKTLDSSLTSLFSTHLRRNPRNLVSAKFPPGFHHSQRALLQPPLSERSCSSCRSFLTGHPALPGDPVQTIFYAGDAVILFQRYSEVTHLLKTLSRLPFPLRIKAKFLHLQRWMNK